MVEEFFCQKCGRLKTRCICKQEEIRERNLKLLREIGYKKDLEPIFNCEDEIVLYRILRPFNEEPTEDLDFLPEALTRALRKRGIEKLYEFQKKAIEELRKGKNVVITAPTGFGKTEAFVIPMIEKVAKQGKGMIFYPTKALARDQESKIKEYASSLGLRVVRFDGDSTTTERREVLSGRADIVLTNPDMVHYHLLNTPAFRAFCRNLTFIAIDELHTYTGVLGTNMHYLLARLARFSDFQLACASATLSNAKEFAEELFEREFVHIEGKHRKSVLNLIMRYTPSIYSSVKDIVLALPNKKIIVFGNSYKTVETVNLILRRAGVKSAVHKGGLPRDVREKVEEEFKRDRIRVAVATPTLELGIDVGNVDVVISELVPYSQFQQRVGRAGRMGQESVGILLLREEDSISTYYRSNPEEYFREENGGYVEKLNEEIMKYHLLSMCLEKPLDVGEIKDGWIPVIAEMKRQMLVVERSGKLLARDVECLKQFNMRGAGESVKMFCDGRLIGERVLPIAIKELFPGSIVIHNGVRYRCESIDLGELRAELVEIEHGNEITDPLYTSIPRIVGVESEIEEPVNAVYCSLEITMIVHGYITRNVFDRERKDFRYLEEPVSYKFKTKGFLFSTPFPDPEDYEDYYAGSFHALEHVLIETTDALTGGGSREMGGISTPEGDIFVYDTTAGGSGLSKLLFKKLDRAFEIVYSILKNCECNRIDGCPRCTYSYQCGNNNQPLCRVGALNAVEKILKGTRRKTDWKKYGDVAEFRYFP